MSLTHSPLSCPCGSTSLLPLYIITINSQGTFKPFQNEQNSVKEAGVKGKKSRDVDPKFPTCTSLPSNAKILKAFPKPIPPKLSQASTRQPECGEKVKSKSQDCRLKCYFLTSELWKVIFCIWGIRLRSA